MQSADVYTGVLRAYSLAASQRYAEAMAVLEDDVRCLSLPEGMDLAARIRHETGRPKEAKRIWADCARVFPDYAPARTALDMMRLTTLRRWAFTLCGCSVLLLGVISIMSFQHREDGMRYGVAAERSPVPVIFTFHNATGAEFVAAREWCADNVGSNDTLVVSCRNDNRLPNRWKVFMDIAKEFTITNRIVFTTLPQSDGNAIATMSVWNYEGGKSR
jgi:hypothetical protein